MWTNAKTIHAEPVAFAPMFPDRTSVPVQWAMWEVPHQLMVAPMSMNAVNSSMAQHRWRRCCVVKVPSVSILPVATSASVHQASPVIPNIIAKVSEGREDNLLISIRMTNHPIIFQMWTSARIMSVESTAIVSTVLAAISASVRMDLLETLISPLVVSVMLLFFVSEN